MNPPIDDIEQFWFHDPNAVAKYEGKKIRYWSPYGTWRIGLLQIFDRRDHDDKISAMIHESFYTSPYRGQVFQWRLTEDLYKMIAATDGPDADFELPVTKSTKATAA